MEARHRLPNALVRASLESTRAVLGVWALLLLASVPGLLRVEVDTSTDSVLDRSDPAWAFYEASQDHFGGDETLVVALAGSGPLDAATLKRAEQLTDRFEQLPGVRRVDSLATVPVVHATPEGVLELDPALAGAPAGSEELRRHVAERLRLDRIAPRSLISDDGGVVAVNILLRKGSEGGHESLLARVYELVQGTGAAVSGVPVFRVETNGRTRSEVVFFAPLTGIILTALLLWTFRSWMAVVLCLAPGALGAWVMLAAMGALGAPLTITTMILPSVVLALGCAYAMHMLAAAGGITEPDSLGAALRPVSLPVALSSLTTVVGFAAIALVRIDAVRFVGVFGSIGVLTVGAATLTVVPAGLRLRPLGARPPRGAAWIRGVLRRVLVAWASQHRHAVLVAWGLALVVFSVGISRIDVDTDATQWLPRGNPVRDSYESIRAALSGISPVNVVVEAPAGRSVLEPELLAAIDALAEYLESLPDVGKAVSIADPLRQIHGGFTGDQSQPLPQELALAEQYLLLLESVEHISDLVTDDRRLANIPLRVDHNGSSHLLAVGESARRWWRSNGVAAASIQPTGIMFEYARAEDEIAMGQLRGLAFALSVISVLLLSIFRWPRLALVALVPNVLPLAVVFGLMGLLRVPLDAGTVLVGGLALGIAVDDTIHVTSGFVDRVHAGQSTRSALDGALESVLAALVFTTVIVALAFLVLGLSEFTFTRNLGLLTAVIMVLCFLADATLLPALLLWLPVSQPGARASVPATSQPLPDTREPS